MYYCLIKIGVKKYKTDELLDSLRTFSDQFQKDSGCQGYNIYRDYHKPNYYTVVCEWETSLAMQQHFQTDHFKILIGATRVLGESSELLTAEKIS